MTSGKFGKEAVKVPHTSAAGGGITRERLKDGSLLAEWRAAALPGYTILSDEEIEASLRKTLSRRVPGEEVWVFGYGSLIWNPAFNFIEKRAAFAHGFHRSFCVETKTGRGSPEKPGLALALDIGGSCKGLAFQIADSEVEEELLLVWRREMVSGVYKARWIDIRFDGANGKRARAVTFVANRCNDRYVSGLSDIEIASKIADARGAFGTCREYLENTIRQLNELGFRDSGLERIRRCITGSQWHGGRDQQSAYCHGK